MQTFQIFKTVSIEYFIEAESEAQAIEIASRGEIEPQDTTELSILVADTHDGQDWQFEPTQGK